VIIGIMVVVLVVLVGIAAKKYQAKKNQDAGPTPAPGIQPAPAPAPEPEPEPIVPTSTDMVPVVFASPPTPKGASMEQKTDLADLRKTAERKAQLAVQMAATSSASSLLSGELQPLKMPELRKRAKAAGVPDDTVGEACDGDSPKQDVIALIVAAAAAAQGLQSELEELTVKQLRARATAAGVSGEAIEDARDGDSPKLDLISLLLAQPRAQP
jgi:hypothetical protein